MTLDLDSILGHRFGNPDLKDQALTHASTGKTANNERLEFLGDRVLGLLVADMLYDTFPDEDEGSMARRHTALVQENALAEVAQRLDLGRFLTMSSSEEKSGGADKPAILADALEAVIAALYLDGGLDVARTFVEREWRPMLDSHTAPPQDPKTALQEWVQARGLPLPDYALAEKSGTDHAPVFTIKLGIQGQEPVTASAGSKRSAEKEAARLMLQKLADKT